jgi:hypothetical protein
MIKRTFAPTLLGLAFFASVFAALFLLFSSHILIRKDFSAMGLPEVFGMAFWIVILLGSLPASLGFEK